jgi:hypothetical protein
MRREDIPFMALTLGPIAVLAVFFWFLTGSPIIFITVAFAAGGLLAGLYFGRRNP